MKLSAGDFKVFVKQRYPKLKAADVDKLVEKNYGKDKGAEKLNEPASSEK